MLTMLSLRNLKTFYIIVGLILFFTCIIGVPILFFANSLSSKFLGAIFIFIGIVGAGYLDTWAHIHLSKFKILWEMNRCLDTTIEHELRRSEAQDL